MHNRNERLGLQDQRQRLPVFQHRRGILWLVESHATTIIVGETGSGKTTQIPQYLHEAGWTAGACSRTLPPGGRSSTTSENCNTCGQPHPILLVSSLSTLDPIQHA